MKVLLSAHQNGHTNLQNQKATKNMLIWLKANRFVHTACQGVYKGTSETSFLIECRSHNSIFDLLEKAWQFNQECVLVMQNNGTAASLNYPDGRRVVLGDFKPTLKLKALQQDVYTILNGEYYVCN